MMHVFLIAGQSNAQGFGFMDVHPALPNDDRVYRLIENRKEIAVEPLHHWPEHPWFPPEKKRGFSWTVPFAHELLNVHPDWQIGLIPAAVGGSPIDDWLPGKTNFVRALKLAGTQKPEAILWHQGEADSSKNKEDLARSYKDKFLSVMGGFRKEFNDPDLPVIAIQLHKNCEVCCPYREILNEQLARGVKELGHAVLVSTDGLPPSTRDPIHMDTPALRLLGARAAKAYLEMQK